MSRSTKIFKDGSVKKSVFGKEFLTKEKWIEWCYKEQNYKNFMIIYNQFVKSGFQRKFSPSIDRINSNMGYLEDNLQWLNLSSNSSKGNK